MANKIGPSIWGELTAAGVPLDGFSIDMLSGTLAPAPDLDKTIVGRIRAVIAAHDPTRAEPIDLSAYIAAAHVALRDGGVTIGGMRIKTDSESRGLIDGAYALSTTQPESTLDFKAASGWVTIDSQTMQTVAIAVGRWVQACYSAYRRIDEARAAGTITTSAQVDTAYAAVTLPA